MGLNLFFPLSHLFYVSFPSSLRCITLKKKMFDPSFSQVCFFSCLPEKIEHTPVTYHSRISMGHASKSVEGSSPFCLTCCCGLVCFVWSSISQYVVSPLRYCILLSVLFRLTHMSHFCCSFLYFFHLETSFFCLNTHFL